MTTSQVIGSRYELRAPLGRGGMGEVWDGFDRQLERRVAVKLLTNGMLAKGASGSRALVRRFVREASVTAGLQHPGVPAVHDAGTYAGGMYLVMEIVDGCTVGDLMAEQESLPIPWVAAIGAQVCAVLAVAHEQGLVHRDIKPQNLMLTDEGTIKVLDFGVAGVLDPDSVSRITRTGEAVGTPAYMAPEQLRSERVVPQTDLYALGCVLYEMLAGERIFAGASSHALGLKHLEEEPQSPRRLRPEIPAELERLVMRMLAKTPKRRPVNAREVYDRLLSFVDRASPLGTVDPATFPTTAMSMYARVLVRISGEPEFRDTPPPAAPVPPSPPPAPPTVPATPPPNAPRYSPVAPPWQPAGAPSPYPPGAPRSAWSGPPPMPWAGAPAPQRLHGIGWKLLHSLWMLPTLIIGLFTWASFFYIGVRHRRVPWLIAGACYFVLFLGFFAVDTLFPGTAEEISDVSGVYMLVVWFGGMVHAAIVNPLRLRLRAGLAQGPPFPYRPEGAP